MFGLWAVNIGLMCLFVFYFKLGLKGIWLAKICTEVFYLLCYYFIFSQMSWETRIERMRAEAEEQQKMLSNVVSSQEMYFDKGFRTERTDIPHDNRPAGPASVPPRARGESPTKPYMQSSIQMIKGPNGQFQQSPAQTVNY